jgi:hypothetical protein
MPRGLGLVSQPHALMATCPPNQLRPVLLQGVSQLCRSARRKPPLGSLSFRTVPPELQGSARDALPRGGSVGSAR